MKYCVKCGQQLPDQAMFCSKCGAKQPNMENSAPAPQVGANQDQPKDMVAKKKTDFSAYLTLRTFCIWGGAPLLLLLANIIMGIIGYLATVTIIFQMLFGGFGIAICVVNFVKRLNRKIYNHETFTAISLATLDGVSLICALIFLSVG